MGLILTFSMCFRGKKKAADTKYISLIGLSVAESPFFLDIFPKIKKVSENIKLLLVGGGLRLSEIRDYINKNKNKSDYIITGFIPYSKIRKYFFITDVGLYPTLQDIYFDCACPIKVMEYTAAKKPIVTTDLKELKRLNFPNIFLAKPTSEDFVDKIKLALNYNGPFPDLKNFDWKYLSNKLEQILNSI